MLLLSLPFPRGTRYAVDRVAPRGRSPLVRAQPGSGAVLGPRCCRDGYNHHKTGPNRPRHDGIDGKRMSTAVFRTGGPDFDVDAFLTKSPGIRVESVWRRGEVVLSRRVRKESGFAAPIAESEDSHAVMESLSRFLSRCSSLIADLAASGATSVIDISLEVGSDRHYTRSLQFAPDVRRQLARLGVGLEISGYPVSDN